MWRGDSGRGETGRTLQRDDLHAGVRQFLDDPKPERIVPTDDDVVLHAEHRSGDRPIAKGERGGQYIRDRDGIIVACVFDDEYDPDARAEIASFIVRAVNAGEEG